MFPHLFHRTSKTGHEGDCECARPAWTPGMPTPVGQGPFLVPPTSSIPITNVPTTSAPKIFKVPPAAPTPYVPAN